MVGEGQRHSEERPSSVVIVSTLTPTLIPSSPYHGSPAQCTQSLFERKQEDICFTCGKQGHWAQDCLSSTPTKASSPQDIHQFPVLRCHCGVDCTISVSRSKANPGRRYYIRNCNCDNVKARGKSFFQWCDNVKAPMCNCGAGACTIVSTLPPNLIPSSPYHESPAQCTQSLSERKQKDICFRCGKQGHWAQDCLSSTPTKASSPQDIHQLPVLRCHCGVGCTISVSRSEANPGRRYYIRNCNCDNVKATRGKSFFQWCDNVKAPMCKCGAGACTINILRDNEGKDTKYYTCRIRTGHGSCGFFQFDGPNSWPRSVEKDKQPSILSPQHGEPPDSTTHEDECPIPSFSNRNIVVHEVETSNFVMGKGHPVSRLTSRSDILSRQMEFWNQISAAGNSPNGCKVLQILGLQVHGWMGRLAFPPPRILADPTARHFFCSIFPLFDPILVSENVNIPDSGSSCVIPHASSNAEVDEVSQNALTNDTQRLGVPLGTSSPKRLFTAMQEAEINPILKEVGKNIQKDFLRLLESMEPVDHDTMLQAANATFDVLASVECGPFAEILMKSQCTSRVAQMESTLQDNCNLHVPTINKNIEKCLDDISGIHAEAFAALTASSNYLQSVHKVTSHFKDMLHQIGKLETFLLDVAKDVGQSKRSMQATYQELTKSLETSAGGRRALHGKDSSR
ncbi:hypothetical protein CRYUN_Cryun14cG0148400 [Craigia yunnanensis]